MRAERLFVFVLWRSAKGLTDTQLWGKSMVGKASEKEQEYFLKQEIARLKKLREEHLANMKKEERDAMKKLHYLRCAKCGQKMETESLGGVEIEVCPDCGGIYLDAGELGKIVDESSKGRFAETLGIVRKLWGK